MSVQLARQFIDDMAAVDHDMDDEDDQPLESEPPGISLETNEPTVTPLPLPELPEAPPKQRKKVSWVWQYFDAAGPGRDSNAICKICKTNGQEVSVSRS